MLDMRTHLTGELYDGNWGKKDEETGEIEMPDIEQLSAPGIRQLTAELTVVDRLAACEHDARYGGCRRKRMRRKWFRPYPPRSSHRRGLLHRSSEETGGPQREGDDAMGR